MIKLFTTKRKSSGQRIHTLAPTLRIRKKVKTRNPAQCCKKPKKTHKVKRDKPQYEQANWTEQPKRTMHPQIQYKMVQNGSKWYGLPQDVFENWPTEQRHAHSVLITSLKFPLFSCASLNFVSLSRKLWTFDHQTCVISAWLDTVPSQLIVYWFIALQFHWVTLRRNPPFQKHTFFSQVR